MIKRQSEKRQKDKKDVNLNRNRIFQRIKTCKI